MSGKVREWLKVERGRPLVIAHGDERGSGLYPGNTMLYLCEMVALGVDALEIDLNLTADDHLVLIHDERLERTTDGEGAIIEKSLAELRPLNAAYHWSRDGSHFPYRDDPQPLVTIDAVFAAFPQTPFIIELKNNDARAARALASSIEKAQCTQRVVVSSFHRNVIREFRTLAPEVATGATLPEALMFYLAQGLHLERFLKPAYSTMQLPMQYYGLPVFTRRFISAARSRDIHLSVWTVDDTEQMKRYMALGLDGLVTNRPDRLLALLEN